MEKELKEPSADLKPTIGFLCAHQDKKEVSGLKKEFVEQGYVLREVTPQMAFEQLETTFNYLIIISSAYLLDEFDSDLLKQLQDSNKIILFPLYTKNTKSDFLLPDISNISLSKSAKFIFNRLDLLISLGIENLLNWEQVQAEAEIWKRNGEKSENLLNEYRIPLVSKLSETVLSELYKEEDQKILRLLTASEKYYEKLRKSKRNLLFFFAAILVFGGILAIVQKRTADQAASKAYGEAAKFQSKDLSLQTREVLTVDPDLPWQLAHQALQLSINEDSLSAANTVLSNLVPHKSYSLPATPVSLDMMDTNNCVIGLSGGRGVVVFDRQKEKIIFSKSTESNEDLLVSSNTHASSFLTVGVESGQVEFFHYKDGEVAFVKKLKQQLDSVEWWLTATQFLGIFEGRLLVVDVENDTVLPYLLPDKTVLESTVVSVTGDKKGTWLAVADTEMLTFYSLKNSTNTLPSIEKKITEKASPGIYFIYANNQADTLLLSNESGFFLVNTMSIESMSEEMKLLEDFRGYKDKRCLAADEHGLYYSGGAAGTVFVLAASFPTVTPRFSYPYSIPYISKGSPMVPAVQAHNQYVVDIVTQRDGSWITIGQDGALRVWESPVFGNEFNCDLSYEAPLYGNDYFSSRYSLSTAGTDGKKLLATVPNGVGFAVMNRQTLLTEKYVWLWTNQSFSRAKTSESNQVIVFREGADRVSVTPGTVETADEVSAQTKSFDVLSSRWIQNSLFDLAASGEEFAVVSISGNNEGSLTIMSLNDEEPKVCQFAADAKAIAISAFGKGEALTISSLGSVIYSSKERFSLFDSPKAITAATALSKERFLSVDEFGNFYRHEKGKENQLLSTNADMINSFLIKTSPNEKYAALNSRDHMIIVEIETGYTISKRLPLSIYDKSFPVDDILFDEDEHGAVVVYANGWISRITLQTELDIVDYMATLLPLELIPGGKNNIQ